MVVEVVTFRPRAGTTEAELRAAESAAYAEAMVLPGMIRRTAAVGDDGEWLVLQLWGDRDTAEAGERASAASPGGAALVALAEPGSLTCRRYDDLGG